MLRQYMYAVSRYRSFVIMYDSWQTFIFLVSYYTNKPQIEEPQSVVGRSTQNYTHKIESSGGYLTHVICIYIMYYIRHRIILEVGQSVTTRTPVMSGSCYLIQHMMSIRPVTRTSHPNFTIANTGYYSSSRAFGHHWPPSGVVTSGIHLPEEGQ